MYSDVKWLAVKAAHWSAAVRWSVYEAQIMVIYKFKFFFFF